MVLEIGIMDDGDVAVRSLERCLDRLALAAVLCVAKERPLDARLRVRGSASLVVLETGQRLGGAVRLAVVDDDDLEAREMWARLKHPQPPKRLRHEILLVVDGYEDAKRSGHNVLAGSSARPCHPCAD